MGERGPQYINERTFKENGSQELWVCSVQERREQRTGSHCHSHYWGAFISPVCDLSHSYRIIRWGLEAWSGEPAWQAYGCNTGEPQTLAAKAYSHASQGLWGEEHSAMWAHSLSSDLIPACRPLVTKPRGFKKSVQGWQEGSGGKVLAELDPQSPSQKPGHSDMVYNSSTAEVETGACWLESSCVNVCTKKTSTKIPVRTMTSTLSVTEVMNRQMTPNKQRKGWQEFLGLKNFMDLH